MPATKATKATLATAKSKVRTLIGSKSKTGDPVCSDAVSKWKTGGTLTHELAVILARCREKLRVKRGVSRSVVSGEAETNAQMKIDRLRDKLDRHIRARKATHSPEMFDRLTNRIHDFKSQIERHERGLKYIQASRNVREIIGKQDVQRQPEVKEPLKQEPVSTHEPKTEFGLSNSKVNFFDEHDRSDAKRLFKKITGEEYSDEKITSLAGIPDDMPNVGVTEYVTDSGVGLAIDAKDHRLEMSRILYKENGKIKIHNDFLFINTEYQGKGLGSEIFGRQVENARKMGVSEINTYAARSEGHNPMNGYYTWPRLGYDGDVPDYIVRRIPADMKVKKDKRDKVKVSSLMQTEEGRQWWKNNGTSMEMVFSLKPDSTSLKAYDFYMDNKKKSMRK